LTPPPLRRTLGAMPPVMKIQLIKIGQIRARINYAIIEKWRSDFFVIGGMSEVPQIRVDHFADGYLFPNEKLKEVLTHDRDFDLTVGIIDQPIEGNYYMHRLDGHTAIISLHEIKDILRMDNIPAKNFLLRCIYEMVVFFHEGGGVVDDRVYMIPHDETRGCLFDMNVFKSDIVFSTIRPTICSACESRLSSKTLPTNFIPLIKKEIKKLDKKLYYRLVDFTKNHPLISILITAVFAVILNLLANFIYDLLKSLSASSAG
jgi:hypothetical protein